MMKFRVAALFIAVLLFCPAAVCLCSAQEPAEETKQDTALGELKLQGKYIERLVLQRKDGYRERINQPAETINLPIGQYRLQEARLQGGYTCYIWETSGEDWVTVTEDKPAVFKIGAPLKQTIETKRKGCVLVLDYKLLGTGGETYTSSDRSNPPTFTVYKGDKKIASGKFEFG